MTELKVTISVSRSRKLNLALYDDKRPYEGADFFQCETEDIPLHEATPKKRNEVRSRLERSVDRGLTEQIKKYLTKLKESKK